MQGVFVEHFLDSVEHEHASSPGVARDNSPDEIIIDLARNKRIAQKPVKT